VTATRVTASIDAVLATGNPVIVGMKVYGGTHFIVLVSGSKAVTLCAIRMSPPAKILIFRHIIIKRNI